MTELIREDDTLNQGRKKLNNAIKAFNETVVEGDSSVEAAQARVDADGHVYDVLKERLDTEQEDVRQFKEDFDTLIARIGNNEELNTTQKATLILAINEINSKADSNENSINDINDSISQLADHRVIDEGENANGYYRVYADGWAECYKQVRSTGELVAGESNSVPFPIKFSESPYGGGSIYSNWIPVQNNLNERPINIYLGDEYWIVRLDGYTGSSDEDRFNRSQFWAWGKVDLNDY